jgi:hypothetical protein
MPAAGKICGQEIGPDACEEPVFSRGMCRRHYRRTARGAALEPPGPALGSPSGHGRYGLIDPDGERIVCHECGRSYIALGVHVAMRHGLAAGDYRTRHGLTRGVSLAAPALAQRLAEAALDNGGPTRLAEARSPDTLVADQATITRGINLAAARRRPR